MSPHIQPLLFEIQTEELPPKALKNMAEFLANQSFAAFKKEHFLQKGVDDSALEVIATPRRMGFLINQVHAYAPDLNIDIRLLPLKVAFPEFIFMPESVSIHLQSQLQHQRPSSALLKKIELIAHEMQATDISAENITSTWQKILPQLRIESDGKQLNLHINYLKKGSALTERFPQIMQNVLQNLPIPKVMSYQKNQQTYQFARPVKHILALHGDAVLSMEMFGLVSGRQTLSHRFMGQGVLEIDSAKNYLQNMQKNFVISNFATRRAMILEQLQEKASALNADLIAPDALLDEITALVEHPSVYTCEFEPQFLEVPQECLILTMQTNQKYIALARDGRLINQFLIVSNIQTDMPHHIIQGNQKVIRPRLADAKFFYQQDQKQSLEQHAKKLEKVIYQQKLGTQSLRLIRIRQVAALLNQSLAFAFSNELIQQTAELIKADLCTDMVGEFPELQGVMGRYYALNQNVPEVVANAIQMHYYPRFSGDELPCEALSILFALSEKLETIVGIFLVGLQPTAEKDPFALRRHALGILRIILEKNLSIDLKAMIPYIIEIFTTQNQDIKPNELLHQDIYDFMSDRLVAYLKQNFAPQNIQAVLSMQKYINPDILVKLRVLAKNQNQLAPIIAANKRIFNILKKQAPELLISPSNTNLPLYLIDTAEINLQDTYFNCAPLIEKMQSASTEEALQIFFDQLKVFEAPLSDFFEQIMVMVDDNQLRQSRLNLLARVYKLMNQNLLLQELA